MVFNERISSSDDFYTPEWITNILCDQIDFKDRFVWECAMGMGHIGVVLHSRKATVINSDISFRGLENPFCRKLDFLQCSVPGMEVGDRVTKPDCIVTNPPFSLKNQFLERCIDLGLPFALLMPLPALESKDRRLLFERINDLTVIIPDSRVAFINGDNRPNFTSCWFCSGFNLGKQLIFIDSSLYKPKKVRKKKSTTNT